MVHLLPDFHAEYGGEQMIVAIETFELIAGKLRPGDGPGHGMVPPASRRTAAHLGPRLAVRSLWIRSSPCRRFAPVNRMLSRSPSRMACRSKGVARVRVTGVAGRIGGDVQFLTVLREVYQGVVGRRKARQVEEFSRSENVGRDDTGRVLLEAAR